MNIWTFAKNYMSPYKIKGSEIVPKVCPFCKGGTHKDEYTFALNYHKNTYNCKRGSCNNAGNFDNLCRHFGERADKENFEIYNTKKKYKKPCTELKAITTTEEEYLSKRKISKSTLDLYGVSSDGKGNIIFPYYEYGELVFIKFRPARKINKGERKAWREEGGKPILWGMDLCDSDFPLVITEGEFDALTLAECGIKNAVSVPSGSEDFSWIENSWDWLQQWDKIILFGDNDIAGKEMIKKLLKKLGSYKCSIVECEKKDANELLFYHGIQAVIDAVNNAKDVPVYGLLDLADVEQLDIKNIQTISTGIKALDEATGGCMLGDLSVWTGRRGEGKSTLLSQLMVEAIETNKKVCCYSGELRADRFQYWFNLQVAGKNNISSYFDNLRSKDVYYVDKDKQNLIKEWYRGKCFLYDNTISTAKSEESSILKIFEYAVKKYDCKMFVVDNLMTARYENTNERDYYLQQINFVRDLADFANVYNVHVHLIAHPKKQKGNIENDDVSGRSEITNIAHNVFSIERDENNDKYDVIVKILKNRWEGSKLEVGLLYCPVSRRMYQPSTGSLKKYSWEYAELLNQDNINKDCPF